MKKTIIGIVLGSIFLAAPAYAFAPELSNRDEQSYKYKIVCGGETTDSSIDGNTTTSLSGSEGCKLVVKGAGSAKLAADMKCKIKDHSLDCE